MTHSYTICEQRYDFQMDGMPRGDSRMSGKIGCGGSTKGEHFFRHDPLEEELDPCLSAAVRYKREKGGTLLRIRNFLCCLVVFFAIALLALIMYVIFGGHNITNANRRINTIQNGRLENKPLQTFEIMVIKNLGPDNDLKGTRIIKDLEPQRKIGEAWKKPSSMPSTVARPVMTRPTSTITTPYFMKPKPFPRLPPIPPVRKMITTTTTAATTTTKKITTTTTTTETLRPFSRIGNLRDCQHYHKSSKMSNSYQLAIPNYADFHAYCQMEPEKGWIVLQRRTSDKWPFWNATFEEYAYGFGDRPNGDHWLGLDRVHALAVHAHKLEMRIELKGDLCTARSCSGLGDSGFWWGEWEFTIGDRLDGYRIKDLRYLSGNISDANKPEQEYFSQLCNNQTFTTVDRDSDGNEVKNCAEQNKRGAWWHKDCAMTAPNGEYGDRKNRAYGQFWKWRSPTENITMMSYNIKPKYSLILFRLLK